ncbi:hypothetical protein BAUCODRAFT_223412 [Baudoinia panamericana UAMH 10762]|uniref:Uncharacterized protein n=1 Tax=Baudoinia panamericana (strain UAMH 10762) TaxID=717646 RepID=M2N567_BAUPA|nr:uncharacterized protein BAUCODRAFT_223412 [Baudoinia panamericana UAMH 10762]EMC94179.1 hypothetical protein BAUCODRAFT_223412 [Baudoinia panamericana UAMH 10762]
MKPCRSSACGHLRKPCVIPNKERKAFNCGYSSLLKEVLPLAATDNDGHSYARVFPDQLAISSVEAAGSEKWQTLLAICEANRETT